MAVRREKVILELDDHFSTKMAKAAAAAALLDRNLDTLSDHAVGLSRDNDRLGQSFDRGGKQIDRYSGRLAILAQTAAMIAPALAPIGAAGIPAVAGLTAGLGALAGAVGVGVLAFNGMGDALDSLNKYQAEPTAENLQAMRVELQKLGPDGAHFVKFLDSLEPQLRSLQMAAREGLLPGVEEGITSLLDKLPQVRRIVREMSSAMGELAADGGADLAGPRWREFFDYLDREAAPTLETMGRTLGNFATGFAQMLADVAPLTNQFAGGLENLSRRFAEWTAGLDQNQGFQEFLAYVSQSGPKALDLIGAIAQTLASIAKAAAPVGDIVLPVLTALVKALGLVADSQLGPWLFTATAAFSVYSRAAALATTATEKLALSQSGIGRMNQIASYAKTAAAGLGMVAVAMTDVDDKAGLSNTAMLGIAGTMAGPWGAAAGAAVGLTMDLAAANNDLETAIDNANLALASGTIPEVRQRYRELRDELRETKKDMDQFWSMDRGGEGFLETIKGDMNALTTWLSGGTAEAEDKLIDLQTRMATGRTFARLYGDAIGVTGRQIRVAAGDAQALSTALSVLEGWLDHRAAVRNYEQSIDDLSKALKNRAGAWDRDTQAGRNNLDLLDATATSLAQVASQMKNDEARTNFLQNARRDLIQLGKASPEAAREVEKVIDRLDAIGLTVDKVGKKKAEPKIGADDREFRVKTDGTLEDLFRVAGIKVEPKIGADNKRAKGKVDETNAFLRMLDGKTAMPTVDADTFGAMSKLGAVRSELAQIRDKVVTVSVNRVGDALGSLGFASGGLVLGPGGPTDDMIPALLSNREFVMPAAAVEHYGLPMMEMVRARQFATGGLVTAGGEATITRFRAGSRLPVHLEEVAA